MFKSTLYRAWCVSMLIGGLLLLLLLLLLQLSINDPRF
jgi:hypothetical protein